MLRNLPGANQLVSTHLIWLKVGRLSEKRRPPIPEELTPMDTHAAKYFCRQRDRARLMLLCVKLSVAGTDKEGIPLGNLE